MTHQPNMHCAGGAAVSSAQSPVQRHTMVAAHVLKAPLSPTWKTELLPATLSVALLLKCSNLTASQSRVESRASSQKSFRKEWRQVLACDLLNDGFYHVARSLRDPTGLLDLLLDKACFRFRADTWTSGPCTSYNQVPVFVFAAAASTHQAHLLCTSTLGALPRLAICGVS